MGISGSSNGGNYKAIFSGDIPWNLGLKNRPFFYGYFQQLARPATQTIGGPAASHSASPGGCVISGHVGPNERPEESSASERYLENTRLRCGEIPGLVNVYITMENHHLE